MNDDELMAIGRFARLSGLTVHALRHYDDVGLLRPAEVDPQSGYRHYVRGQIATARLIRALRWIDLPIDEIRAVIDGSGEDGGRHLLTRHRQLLERRREHLTAQIGDVERFLSKGIAMPAVHTGCTPVQIKIAVDDAEEAVAFYRAAFDLKYDVTRRTKDEDYSGFVFGEYGKDGFFLLHLVDDPSDLDRPGSTTLGLLVADLDESHTKAIAAGATEAVSPHSPEGMPRCSAVRDPSGNWVWLYQG